VVTVCGYVRTAGFGQMNRLALCVVAFGTLSLAAIFLAVLQIIRAPAAFADARIGPISPTRERRVGNESEANEIHDYRNDEF
jgi:hypothetical protein